MRGVLVVVCVVVCVVVLVIAAAMYVRWSRRAKDAGDGPGRKRARQSQYAAVVTAIAALVVLGVTLV